MLVHEPAWHMCKAQVWRSLGDIAADWAMIIVATWVVYRIGWTFIPFGLVAVGNRQRALGNLLHEASHRNLSGHRRVNDGLAHLLLAPPLLNNLQIYRDSHAQHHAWLGHPLYDPDYLHPVRRDGDHWYHAYARYLTAFSMLRSTLIGHLFNKRASAHQQLYIFLWWVVLVTTLALIRPHFSAVFFALWVGSRITFFHAITTFREMTDHYGLEPDGIFKFTREVLDHGLLSMLIHPHHNGYHLTHHLFPSVPYHQLPRTHALLMGIGEYRDRAFVCSAYFGDSPSGVAGWGADHA